jgi:hypothetical protein
MSSPEISVRLPTWNLDYFAVHEAGMFPEQGATYTLMIRIKFRYHRHRKSTIFPGEDHDLN